MPENIETKHINRMFPFEFYAELSEKMTEYTINNPAFLLADIIEMDADKKRMTFLEARDDTVLNTLHQNNIIDVEPFGEVLSLDVMMPSEDVKDYISKKKERSKIPMSILVVQLYDSNDEPVFSKDVTEETIKWIPEVLWDDPNLLIAAISFSKESGEPEAGIIRIPERIEAKILEDK